MPGAAPAHVRNALLALCIVVTAAAAAPAVGATTADRRDSWVIELGPRDMQYARANLRRLRGDGLSTVVVDARRVGYARRAALARLARAAHMSFVVASSTCRASAGCWRIASSPAAGRAARANGHAKIVIRLRDPATVGSLGRVAPE